MALVWLATTMSPPGQFVSGTCLSPAYVGRWTSRQYARTTRHNSTVTGSSPGPWDIQRRRIHRHTRTKASQPAAATRTITGVDMVGQVPSRRTPRFD